MNDALDWENKLVFLLFASPTRQGTLSLWCFLLLPNSVRKSPQKVGTSLADKLFFRISRKYLGSAYLSGSDTQNALGDTFPIGALQWSSSQRRGFQANKYTIVYFDQIVIDDQRLE